MNDKSNPVHDLFKVPDPVIIKSQAVEIGQLKSRVDELEYEAEQSKQQDEKAYTGDRMKEILSLNAALKDRNSQIVGYTKKCEKLQAEIYRLMYKNTHQPLDDKK